MARKPFIGERVPTFTLPTLVNPQFHFDSVAGRWLILAFMGSQPGPAASALVSEAHALRNVFDDSFASVFWVVSRPSHVEDVGIEYKPPGIRYFMDYEAAAAQAYALAPDTWPAGAATAPVKPGIFVIDRNLRLVERVEVSERRPYLAPIVARLRQLDAQREAHGGLDHAPVLIVERIFEAELCKALIEYYHRRGGVDSGFMRERDSLTVGVLDHSFKRRRDCVIEDAKLRDATVNRLHDRLAPEIRRVFQFDPARIERHIVARYDAADGGHFRPHRDNTTKGTAHRRFAVTVNLNAGEYEGGDLRFPEFGRRTYRAPTGGAIVFSCSLLHEATEVTKGTRFAYLPFLYTAADAELRERNRKFLADDAN